MLLLKRIHFNSLYMSLLGMIVHNLKYLDLKTFGRWNFKLYFGIFEIRTFK